MELIRTIFANKDEYKQLRVECKRRGIKIRKASRDTDGRYGLQSMTRELNLEVDVCYQLKAYDVDVLKDLVHVWRAEICK